MTVARQDFSVSVEVTDSMWEFDGDPTRYCHITLVIEQALRGKVNGNQGSRTRRLNSDAGAGQIKLVRDARRQHILIVAGLLDQKEAARIHQLLVWQQVVDKVGIKPRTGIDPD